MSVLGYVLVLGGFACAALWLVSMAGGHVAAAVLFGLLMIGAFTFAASIFLSLNHRHHHSPVLPDNTDSELDRYMHRYRE